MRTELSRTLMTLAVIALGILAAHRCGAAVGESVVISSAALAALGAR